MTTGFTRGREGDFIETIEGLIFDVKGLIHPPDRIISFLRYVPSPDGDRERKGVRYKKIYNLKQRWNFLRRYFPGYIHFDDYFGRELQGVPLENVHSHYDPSRRLSEPSNDEVELDAIQLARRLIDAAGVRTTSVGISGSVLVGLQEPESDVDIIIYGIGNSRRVYQALRNAMSSGDMFEAYDIDDLGRLFKSRSMERAMKFDDFCTHERRKVLQGNFKGRDYFVRCIRDWDEIREPYGSFTCQRLGRKKISAIVSDDSESIFTPCTYEVEKVSMIDRSDPAPKQILSFRGRFCEQAKTGERITAYGDLEHVSTKNDEYYQLVVGESSLDFIVFS